jgi:hypothetical protein
VAQASDETAGGDADGSSGDEEDSVKSGAGRRRPASGSVPPPSRRGKKPGSSSGSRPAAVQQSAYDSDDEGGSGKSRPTTAKVRRGSSLTSNGAKSRGSGSGSGRLGGRGATPGGSRGSSGGGGGGGNGARGSAGTTDADAAPGSPAGKAELGLGQGLALARPQAAFMIFKGIPIGRAGAAAGVLDITLPRGHPLQLVPSRCLSLAETIKEAKMSPGALPIRSPSNAGLQEVRVGVLGRASAGVAPGCAAR